MFLCCWFIFQLVAIHCDYNSTKHYICFGLVYLNDFMIQIYINSIELNTLNLFYETLFEISFKIKTPS